MNSLKSDKTYSILILLLSSWIDKYDLGSSQGLSWENKNDAPLQKAYDGVRF